MVLGPNAIQIGRIEKVGEMVGDSEMRVNRNYPHVFVSNYKHQPKEDYQYCKVMEAVKDKN
jgi:hypothetical protein